MFINQVIHKIDYVDKSVNRREKTSDINDKYLMIVSIPFATTNLRQKNIHRIGGLFAYFGGLCFSALKEQWSQGPNQA